MGEILVTLFLGFFGLLAGGALAAQLYGLTGAAERRRLRRPNPPGE